MCLKALEGMIFQLANIDPKPNPQTLLGCHLQGKKFQDCMSTGFRMQGLMASWDLTLNPKSQTPNLKP